MPQKYWPAYGTSRSERDWNVVSHTDYEDDCLGYTWETAIAHLKKEIEQDGVTAAAIGKKELSHPVAVAIALAILDNGFVPGQIVSLHGYTYTILEDDPS